MKKNIHPATRPVVFRDSASGAMFLAHSVVRTKETIEYEDGKKYPLCPIEISSATHPFYTGKQKLIDSAGRIEQFRRRYNIKD